MLTAEALPVAWIAVLVDRPRVVAVAWFTSLWVGVRQVLESKLALRAFPSSNVLSALALTSSL